jgi:acyl-CoA dehydrogenase
MTEVQGDISAVKIAMPRVLHDVAARALQVHGCLGGSNEMPFGAMVIESFTKGLADGPTEVHKVTLARHALKTHRGRPLKLGLELGVRFKIPTHRGSPPSVIRPTYPSR